MMRIALFGTVAGMGGIERHTRLLGNALLDAGCEVMVISSVLDLATSGEMRPEENQSLIQKGAKIHWLPEQKYLFGRIREALRLAQEVRRFDPSILLGSQTSYHLGLLGVLLPRRVRKIFFEVMSGESKGRTDPRWLVKQSFHEVVGQSPRVTQNFARSFGFRKTLATIPAFPEPLERTAKLPQATRRSVPMGEARAGFFSRLVEGKQAFWLVKQWSLLKGILRELHIHGRGPEQPLIEAFIAENGLGESVFCHGGYPTGQAYADLIAGYDLTLLPTVFPEGAPLVLLESMACGVPFVANGVGGVPDYATENPDCVVVNQQSEFIGGVHSMAEALASGAIDQRRLQGYYLERYSHAAIEKRWLNHLGLQPR